MSIARGAVDLNALSLPEMYREIRATGFVRRLLELARDEDLGGSSIANDITTASCPTPDGTRIRADVTAREPCMVAGLGALPDLIEVFGGNMVVRERIADGAPAEKGDVVATIEGPASSVLVLERTMLNLVTRLSGIATHARAMRTAMDAGAPGHRAVLLDTRKTTPGMRVLEKYAVRCGGCSCHRIGLFDAVLLKDNHLAGVGLSELAGFVEGVAARARARGTVRFIEVEVDTLDQLARVLTVPAGVVDFVLLDNMTPAMLREAVEMRDLAGPGVSLEASGGVTMASIAAIAATGVDRISSGSLTHGAGTIDFGLDARPI